MAFRTQIPTNLIGDEEVSLVDLKDEVRFRSEGVQYPIDIEMTLADESRLFRSEKLILKPTGKTIIQAGGRIVIKR